MTDAWTVDFVDEFRAEFRDLSPPVRAAILAKAGLLRRFGPELQRPHADTLHGSRHANMKELRFAADAGEWRVAFAFDPDRKAIVLVAGDKSGMPSRRFYRRLIRIADRRFEHHLARLPTEGPQR
ncbi:MAG: type II toxin-antitoxin system RelE/ParE family toxin [Defluviicoccus sp.]|nr:type II toxin-antitoxin system RelE/ParE family toxin [Defluviicoccus sp.]MDE0276031.1 type II toxin-antitoxin system RelE/ParE family toxin [Defluviicoccus sp.]